MIERETPERTRETKRGPREGAGPIFGPNETNEEEEEEEGRTTEEVETKIRCISAGVQGHHTDHPIIMVRV